MRQIVVLLSGQVADIGRGQNQPEPGAQESLSATFLSNLLHALLAEQVIRSLFPMPREYFLTHCLIL